MLLDDPKVTTAEYNRVFAIIEREMYPDRCPGMADPKVSRVTQAVFRALSSAARVAETA
jgi:hypothetical protein